MSPTESDNLAKACVRDGAAFVVESMLNSVAANEETPEDRVAVVMRSLEEMAEHRIDAACCLMVSLWPVASELKMHDICDSIDLWIHDNRPPAVVTHLKHLVLSEANSDLKRHFEDLLHHIQHEA